MLKILAKFVLSKRGIMTPEQILNAAIVKWIETSNVNKLITDKTSFIVFKGNNEVDINLKQFSEEYYNKYIGNDMPAHCLKIIKAIEKTMFATLATIEVRDYQFKFTFHYWGKYYGKTVKYYLLSKVL